MDFILWTQDEVKMEYQTILNASYDGVKTESKRNINNYGYHNMGSKWDLNFESKQNINNFE